VNPRNGFIGSLEAIDLRELLGERDRAKLGELSFRLPRAQMYLPALVTRSTMQPRTLKIYLSPVPYAFLRRENDEGNP